MPRVTQTRRIQPLYQIVCGVDNRRDPSVSTSTRQLLLLSYTACRARNRRLDGFKFLRLDQLETEIVQKCLLFPSEVRSRSWSRSCDVKTCDNEEPCTTSLVYGQRPNYQTVTFLSLSRYLSFHRYLGWLR